MTVGNIGLQFGINSVKVKQTYDIRIHVKEDFNYLRYSTQFGNTNTGVAFINSDPITVDKNIIVKDQTASVLENSPRIFSEQTFYTQVFNVTHGKFLISDVFKTTSLNETIPMYYWHNLSLYSSISNVEILDGDFNPVNNDDYFYVDESLILGEQRKGVYTNLKSEYNASENYYTIYYIKFRDLSTGAFITELLNVKPFYDVVDFDVTSKIRAYNVNSGSGGTADVEVYFDSKSYSPTPISGQHRFSIKITGENRISVIKPLDQLASKKWNLRINPGEFYKNVGAEIAHYHVPEYHNQIFSPVAPYKLLVEKEAQIFTDKLLYLDPKPIANVGIDGFYLYLILKDNMGRVKRALTNDPNAGVYITPEGITTNTFYERDSIQSIAENDGFIRLNVAINIDLKAYVTYRYIEDYYVYRGLSVNSTMNSEVLDKRIVIYIRPEIDTAYDKNIFHLLIDQDDNIVKANQTTNMLTIRSEATGGGINFLEDSNLNANDNYVDYELEILSGLNAGRSLPVINTNIYRSTVTVGDVTVTAEIYSAKYNGCILEYVDGATQGNESVSVSDAKIQVMIEDGVSTAADIVYAINVSAQTSDLEATTLNPTATQVSGSSDNFSEANITVVVGEDYSYNIEAGDRYRINKKLNNYSKIDEVTSTLFNYSGWLTSYLTAPNYYITLSDVYVVRSIVPSDINLSDIRIRGGGVSETYANDALKLQDEAQWFWDLGYWDGQPYPGMGAILVNLPRKILKEVGGDFSREQVKDVVQRHMAEGTYPIIEYYDKSTRILDVEPGNSKITISWENVNASSYNVYYGNNPDNLTLYKSAAGIESSMTIAELENDKIYYIRVEAVIRGVPSLPSRMIYAIPFDFSSVKPYAVYGRTVYNEGTYSL